MPTVPYEVKSKVGRGWVMNIRKALRSVLLVLVTATALIAVNPIRTVRADETATKVVIDMDEYHFTVEGKDAGDPINLKVGTLYDLTVKNTGKLPHEIWFGKDTKMAEDGSRLDGYQTNVLATVTVAIIGGEPDTVTGYEIDVTGLIEIAEGPRQSYTIEFTLPDSLKGNWELGCFQPMPKAPIGSTPDATAAQMPDVPHYMVGMKADLIVE